LSIQDIALPLAHRQRHTSVPWPPPASLVPACEVWLVAFWKVWKAAV